MLTTEIATLENDKEWLAATDEQLIAEIRLRLTVCAESLLALASVVGPAMRRHLDLSFINPHLLDVLRKIECHRIVPELAERFMHSRIFVKLKNLPLDDQKEIATTGKVVIVVRRGDSFDTRKMDVDALTKDQAKLVFESGRIRSETEMIAILEDTPEVEADPFDEARVTEHIPSTNLEMTKAQRKEFRKMTDRAGGAAEFIKRLVMQKL